MRNDPAKTPDVTATILDLAGARLTAMADGQSLVPSFAADRGWTPGGDRGILGGSAAQTRANEHASRPRTTIGIRTARYKLIRDVTGTSSSMTWTSTERARQRRR